MKADREINLMMPAFDKPDTVCEQALSIYPDKLSPSYELSLNDDLLNKAEECRKKAEYEANQVAFEVNGKEIFGFSDEPNDELSQEPKQSEPTHLFHITFYLKPEAAEIVKADIKVGSIVSLSEVEGEDIDGEVEKIEGNKLIIGVDLPASFIKRHHITMGDIMRGLAND